MWPRGDEVSVTFASPVGKYMNGSLYDRDGKMEKPRVVTGDLLYYIITH